MNKYLKRSDKIYKEIESFEEYELTNNIAYEMMIRDEEIIKAGYYDFMIKISEYAKDRINNTKVLNIMDIFDKKYINDFRIKMGKAGIDIDRIIDYFNYLLIENYCEVDYNINGKGVFEYGKKITIERYKHIKINYRSQFKRPMIIINHTSKLTNININLSLPENELIAYVKKLKQESDKNKIRNFIDLLAEIEGVTIKSTIYDNIVCNSKGKCFDSRNILSKQEKLADMFYIYDALQYGMTQRKISNEIYNYYADIGIETKTMDDKTLTKYKDIAKDYIDNKRYKELVTGVKI